MAWIDILILCNHQPASIFVRGNKIDIKRGQFAWGEDTLATRWKWSRGKVRRFLIELEKSGNIVQQKDHVLSLYTVLNYNEYQKNDTTDGQQTVQQTDTNNNDNNVNNDNKIQIDTNVSIQPLADRPKKERDIEVDAILQVFEEVNGTIPVDQKPRQWAYLIKKSLTKYLDANKSTLKPSDSLRKFLVNKKEANLPISFNKLQTIYYHLRSTIYKNEKHQ